MSMSSNTLSIITASQVIGMAYTFPLACADSIHQHHARLIANPRGFFVQIAVARFS